MNELIDQVYERIQDYRDDEFFPVMTKVHINNWIMQFEADDREFLLTELTSILEKSYLSKSKGLRYIHTMLDVFAKDLKYKCVAEMLPDCRFLSCQGPEKSQTIFLAMMDDYLQENYNRKVDDEDAVVKYWIYIDDVLSSGNTFFNEISKEIEEYGVEEFIKSDIKIISTFCVIHSWGNSNTKYRLKLMNKDLPRKILNYCYYEIDNNPRLQSYWNPSPKFNNLYPTKSEEGEQFLDYLEGELSDYTLKNKEFAFRPDGHPVNEEYFSSSENRNRYEAIVLKECLKLFYNSDRTKKSLRPLGMTPPTYQTLGTGTHFFTWRNISNTCPLIFWYSGAGWTPLFQVQNRG